MPDVNEWNKGIIAEFRANAGTVGGPYEGTPLLVLHSTGAKSGQARVNPVVYLADGDDYVVFASKAGAPSNPDWYFNLLANPRATIELGEQRIDVVAHVADGERRDRLWARQTKRYSRFAEYEEKAQGRVIPVIVLSPVTATAG